MFCRNSGCCVYVRVRVRVKVRRDFFNVNDLGIELDDDVCDFGLRLRLGVLS